MRLLGLWEVVEVLLEIAWDKCRWVLLEVLGLQVVVFCQKLLRFEVIGFLQKLLELEILGFHWKFLGKMLSGLSRLVGNVRGLFGNSHELCEVCRGMGLSDFVACQK